MEDSAPHVHLRSRIAHIAMEQAHDPRCTGHTRTGGDHLRRNRTDSVERLAVKWILRVGQTSL